MRYAKASLALLLAASFTMAVGAEKDTTFDAERSGLTKLQAFVGSWKGVGQPQRGSNKGAWTEKCEWKWEFGASGQPSLQLAVNEPKHLSAADMHYDAAKKMYTLQAKFRDGEETTFAGAFDDDKLVLLAPEPNVASPSNEARPARITIRQVAGGNRLLLLYERKTEAGAYLRLAEVGYTREGSGFGKGTNFIECIVTGGQGTIPVTHEGKTYYVCCSGCRDYFNEDPEGVLADYRARLEEAKAK